MFKRIRSHLPHGGGSSSGPALSKEERRALERLRDQKIWEVCCNMGAGNLSPKTTR